VVTSAPAGAGAGRSLGARPAVGEPQRSCGERAGGEGGAGATADGAGVIDGAGAAVVRDGTGPFGGRGAATWESGGGDVVSVQTATSAATPTTAVRVASAARVRARIGESGRCNSIATDTAAQPKIASVAMTTAHRWDTRYSLLRSAVRASDDISIILRRGAHHPSGGTKQNFAPFPWPEADGRIRFGPAEQPATSAGSCDRTRRANRVE
jgi:hypothetical protein